VCGGAAVELRVLVLQASLWGKTLVCCVHMFVVVA
jgi:hypothetical protein